MMINYRLKFLHDRMTAAARASLAECRPFALVGLLVAAVSPAASQAPVKGGILVYAERPGIGSGNPYQSSNSTAPTDRAYSMVYEPLYRYNFNVTPSWEAVLALGEPQPTVAMKGGKSAFAVNLRPNVLWHDGTPFTAADVIFTYNYIRWAAYNRKVREEQVRRMVDVRQGSGPLQVIFEFTGTEPEPRERMLDLVIPSARHRRPAAYATTAAAAGSFEALSADKNLDTHPLGTGPYQVDSTMYRMPFLSAFPRYTRGVGNLQVIGGREFTDQSQMVEDFLTIGGSVQMLVEVPPKSFPTIEKNGRVTPAKIASYNVLAVVLRQKPGSVLNQARVRRAMTMAVDRGQLLKQWFADKGEVLASPLSRMAPTFDPSVKALPYDPETAKREVAAAGVPPRTRLQFIYPKTEGASDTHLSDMVQSIRDAIQQLGFTVNLVGYDPAVYEQMLLGEKGDFDMALVRWEFNPAYDISPLFSSSGLGVGGRNSMNYNDPDVNRWLREYESTDEVARQQNAMYRVQAKLNQDAPAIFLLSEDKVYAYHNRYSIPSSKVDPFNFFTYANAWHFRPR